jgi:hypothetical protein
MTCKQKAKQLFDKFCHAIRTEEDDEGFFTNTIHAKRCALFLIEEVIQSHSFVDYGIKPNVYKYWREVKKEIEKL